MHTGELLSTAFVGPWVPSEPGKAQRRHHVYATLLHWYEAAKFMPHAPMHRDAILFCPSTKEVRKTAKRLKDHWRSDWQLVRHRVLVTGLGFLALQRPELKLMTIELEVLSTELLGMGLPARFIELCLKLFDEWRSSPRLAIVGAQTAPPDIVGKRIARFAQENMTWTLVTPCGGKSSWKVHDWCLIHFVPVLYVGTPFERVSRSILRRTLALSDSALVFEQRRSKKHDFTVQTARSLKLKVMIELYDPA